MFRAIGVGRAPPERRPHRRSAGPVRIAPMTGCFRASLPAGGMPAFRDGGAAQCNARRRRCDARRNFPRSLRSDATACCFSIPRRESSSSGSTPAPTPASGPAPILRLCDSTIRTPPSTPDIMAPCPHPRRQGRFLAPRRREARDRLPCSVRAPRRRHRASCTTPTGSRGANSIFPSQPTTTRIVPTHLL
jgi:hypothetical protein